MHGVDIARQKLDRVETMELSLFVITLPTGLGAEAGGTTPWLELEACPAASAFDAPGASAGGNVGEGARLLRSVLLRMGPGNLEKPT
jgi:hypothetical protein